MMNTIKYTSILIVLLLITGVGAHAQSTYEIGGDSLPLYQSTHTYRVLMSNTLNESYWNLYEGTLTVAEVQSGDYTPLVAKTDYGVEIENAGGFAIITIRFLAPSLAATHPINYDDGTNDGRYTLTYREITTDDYKCFANEVFHIHVMPPIDIDIAQDVEDQYRCQDQSGLYQTTDESQSEFVYTVYIEYPDTLANGATGYSGTWEFYLNINTTGDVVGQHTTIAGVAENTGVVSITNDTGIGTRTYGAKFEVTDENVHEIEITVTYNDVLGVTQDISVYLTGISGKFNEVDADEIFGTQGNVITHTIYAMPAVGVLTALN